MRQVLIMKFVNVRSDSESAAPCAQSAERFGCIISPSRYPRTVSVMLAPRLVPCKNA